MGILIGPVECPVAMEAIEISCSGHSRGQDLKLAMDWLRGSELFAFKRDVTILMFIVEY